MSKILIPKSLYPSSPLRTDFAPFPIPCCPEPMKYANERSQKPEKENPAACYDEKRERPEDRRKLMSLAGKEEKPRSVSEET